MSDRWLAPCLLKHLHDLVLSRSFVNSNLELPDLFKIYIEFLDIEGLKGVSFSFILFV